VSQRGVLQAGDHQQPMHPLRKLGANDLKRGVRTSPYFLDDVFADEVAGSSTAGVAFAGGAGAGAQASVLQPVIASALGERLVTRRCGDKWLVVLMSSKGWRRAVAAAQALLGYFMCVCGVAATAAASPSWRDWRELRTRTPWWAVG
jgi:hypothetical protein